MPVSIGDKTERELRRLIVDNFIESSLGFGEFGGVCGEEKGTIWYHTGCAHPFLNAVVGARISATDPRSVVRKTIGHISADGAPFGWVVGPDDTPANLGELLEDAGLQYAFELRGMAMDLHELPDQTNFPLELSFKEVLDGESLEQLMPVKHATLSHSKALTDFLRSYFGDLLRKGDRRWRHFFGSIDGKAVACASIYLNGDIAGIYNVGTLEGFRKRGLGTALTAFSLLQAKKEGYRWAVLHSSAMGFKVYQRIGFKDICALRVHLPEGTLEGAN